MDILEFLLEVIILLSFGSLFLSIFFMLLDLLEK